MPVLLVVAAERTDPRLAAYRTAAATLGHACLVVDGASDAASAAEAMATEAVGVVAVGEGAAGRAAELARRLGRAWHAPEAVRLADDRLQMLGRLTALGLAVPRFTAVDVATGAGVERLAGLPSPWRVTAVPGRRQAVVDDVGALRTLTERWHSGGGEGTGPAPGAQVAVEAELDGPACLVVGLLEGGALRVLGVVDVTEGGPYPDRLRRLAAPSSLTGEAQAHLAGVTAHACAALGLRHGPVVARAAAVGGQVCLVDVAPETLLPPASDVLQIVDPSGARVDLATLVVRHAVGASLEGYALDGRSCHVSLA